jgi:hypothetical protein
MNSSNRHEILKRFLFYKPKLLPNKILASNAMSAMKGKL